MELYTPPDTEDAYLAWGANCGPAALAAVIRRPVTELRALFPGFEERRYVNPTQMQAAALAAGWLAVPTRRRLFEPGRVLPSYGLACLQYAGGWWDEKPVTVQYRFTHWIGVSEVEQLDQDIHCRVYDVNAGRWMSHLDWSIELWPRLAQASGASRVWCRTAFELEPTKTRPAADAGTNGARTPPAEDRAERG